MSLAGRSRLIDYQTSRPTHRALAKYLEQGIGVRQGRRLRGRNNEGRLRSAGHVYRQSPDPRVGIKNQEVPIRACGADLLDQCRPLRGLDGGKLGLPTAIRKYRNTLMFDQGLIDGAFTRQYVPDV